MAEQGRAAEELEADMLAPSTRASTAAKLKTVTKALRAWGMPVFPPTSDSLRALGATLKRGGYRSAGSYLWTYKVEAQRLGHPHGATSCTARSRT